jgi:hypothetical protein
MQFVRSRGIARFGLAVFVALFATLVSTHGALAAPSSTTAPAKKTTPAKTKPQLGFLKPKGSVASARARQRATVASGGAIETLPGNACTANTLPANDDSSTNSIALPFTLNFFGSSFSSLWVNNNGNVSFDGALGEYVPGNLTNTSHPMIAPFWGDVYTAEADESPVTYGATPDKSTFCVDWVNVGEFGQSPPDPLNSFQLLIIDKSGDAGGHPGDFDIVMNYDSIQWGGASIGYTNGSGIAGQSFQSPHSFDETGQLDSSPTGMIHDSLNSAG